MCEQFTYYVYLLISCCMEKLTLKAELRSVDDRLWDLRSTKMIPAVVYGRSQEPISLKVEYSTFLKLFRKAWTNHIVDLDANGKKFDVLVHEVQKNPISWDFSHIDFYAITKGQKISVEIPFKFIGESQAKKDGAIMEEHMDVLEVKCSPIDLIDFIEVDLSKLATIGDNIKVSNLVIDTKKYEILSDMETVVISANKQADEEDLSAPVVLELPKDEKEEAKKAQEALREKEDKGGKE